MTTTRPTGEWAAGYDLGRQHGYERATVDLLHILQERMDTGEDILPLLPLVDELRARTPQPDAARAQEEEILPEQCDECESTGVNCTLHAGWAEAEERATRD